MTTATNDRSAQPVCEVVLKDMGYAIEGRQVLHGLSFHSTSPRIGVVGRNGSGKSTLARLLAGLVAPDSGEVRINGHDLAKDRRAALQQVGILFQNPDHQLIFPTVIEELAFGLQQQGQTKAQAQDGARAVLAQFGVAHWHETYVNTLSQGQKHLVCLMAVVAMAPKLLILDEPFAGLDIPTKAQLRRHLRHYHGALLHISHDPEDLRHYDQLLWIDEGSLRLTGPTDQVLPAYIEAMQDRGAHDDLADLTR